MSSTQSLAERFRTWAPVEAIATKIRAKLLLTLFGVALVPLVILGIVMYQSASRGVLDQANRQLESVRTIKANQVESYFDTINKQIETFSENSMIVDAMRQFPEALRDASSEASVTNWDEIAANLEAYYAGDFTEEYKQQTGLEPPVEAQLAGLDQDTLYLQNQYISGNPNPLGSKEELDRGEDATRYNELHGKYHPIVRNYLKQFGYYDIFLCDLESGDIVYSVYKELDFTTSLIDGPYSETNFGRAFRMAAAAENPDDIFLVDYEPYLPSYESAASFISSPIFDGDTKIGVAIFQMPIARINEIMGERTGLGQSGETYAVGADKLFRSESRFVDQLGIATAIMNDQLIVNTDAANAALAGQSGTALINDYRGTPVLSSWTPITVYPGIEGVSDPIRWALLSEIDYAEVKQPITASGMLRNAGLIVSLGLLGGLFCAIYFAQGITRQAEAINDMLMQIGIGDFDARADVVTNDELGDVAVALNAMCDNTLSLIQSREERDQIEQSIFELVREMEDIADGDLTISAEVREDMTGPIAGSVNFMIGQLRGLVKRVESASNQVSESASTVREISGALSNDSARQAEQISTTSNQVREITASIQSVADKTRVSADVAAKARKSASDGLQAVSDTVDGMQRIRNQVQETSKRIKRLGESSQEIGEIVQLIADIADRTSILALNASIQAAMAGDAGQGFAVVAEEVERLAERSNDATKQIATLIKAIQTETSDAITDMEESTREVVEGSQLATQAGATLSEIDRVSAQLADLIAEVSSATESQSGAARQIAGTMGSISETTYRAASQSQSAADRVGQLADLANELRDSVSQFRVDEENDPATDIESDVELDSAELALAEDMAAAAAMVAASAEFADEQGSFGIDDFDAQSFDGSALLGDDTEQPSV
ncbi:MAG: HAMP domain-containing methyl-accepting chemotaxis protein [Planctomycetota bacterium]